MSGVETVEFIWRLSESLWRDGDFRGARRELRRVDARPALSADVVIGTSVMLNIIEQDAGDHAEAVAVLKRVEPLVKVCRSPVLIGKWCQESAMALKGVGDYDAALPLYETAVGQFEAGRAFRYAATTRNNIGNLFLHLNQPDIAKPYIERAIRECEDEVTLAQFRATRARLLLAEGKYEEAKVEAAESYDFLSMIGERTFADESLRTLGLIERAEMGARVRR